MEQLLIEEAIKASIQKNKIVRYMDMFRQVCLDAIDPVVFHKNNQMQEFDKWKAKKGWIFVQSSGLYSTGHEFTSFEKLFEIFIKETPK